MVTDGVFVEDQAERTVAFHALPPPSDGEVVDVAYETCRRTRAILIRHGRWKEDLDEPAGEDTVPDGLGDLYAASLRGILLFGARRGQRVVRFFGQAAPRWQEEPRPRPPGDPFDIHAWQAVHARRRVNTIRFHGVYAAHARLRKHAVPDAEPSKKSCPCTKESPVRRDGHLAWGELLARVCEADAFQCPRCQAHGMQRIAAIVDHDVVRKILRAVGLPTEPPSLHPPRSAEDLFSETRRARA